MKLQFYTNGIKSNQPSGTVSLETFIERIAQPSDKVVELIDRIALASSKGDKKLKTELKEQLPFVTPSIIVDKYRRYDNIVSFTGLCQIDFDGIENAETLRTHLFSTYPQFYAVYVSPSGKGVKGLLRIPICQSIVEFKEYYSAIQEEFETYDGFDPSPKNAVLPLFVSYDYFCLSRPNPDVWMKRKEEKIMQHIASPILPRPYISGIVNDRNKTRALNTVAKMINGIFDNGHPQLRSACLILGTRIGAGYCSRHEALSWVEHLIRNNGYLQKGVKGYITTATWSIDEGVQSPNFY